MWPKAFAQLVELAPHITRLVPMADRFFQSKAAGEEANRRAMEAMAADVRDNLAQVTAAQTALSRQLSEHGERLSAMAADLQAMKRGTNGPDERLGRLEARVARQTMFSAAVIVLLVAVLILLVLVYLHQR
jgi:hypothetical protein